MGFGYGAIGGFGGLANHKHTNAFGDGSTLNSNTLIDGSQLIAIILATGRDST